MNVVFRLRDTSLLYSTYLWRSESSLQLSFQSAICWTDKFISLIFKNLSIFKIIKILIFEKRLLIEVAIFLKKLRKSAENSFQKLFWERANLKAHVVSQQRYLTTKYTIWIFSRFFVFYIFYADGSTLFHRVFDNFCSIVHLLRSSLWTQF